MNKNEFIDKVADRGDYSKAEATHAVESVLDVITEALGEGQDVRLVGFGVFSCRKRKAREGRNPRTGEKIKIDASMQAKFTPGKALRDAVN